MTTATSMSDVDHYSYRVSWSGEDEEFVATCVELPSLSWLASSPESALRGLRALVADVVADMVRSGATVPESLATRSYSGKFNLRVGVDLHRRLATEAAERHMSLNQHVVSKLSSAS